MKEKRKQLELFLKSSHLYRGIRVGSSVLIPIFILYFLGYFEFAPALVVGTFLNAPSDIPGSKKRKFNAILISIGLTVFITAIMLFSKPYPPLLLGVIALISFLVSLISVYGFRASLVSFSALMAMVLTFTIHTETAAEIWLHLALMTIGGFWYLFISYIFQALAPKKDQNQILSETLQLIGDYLKLRAKLLISENKREELHTQIFNLQHQINEKHETLRESLLSGRKRSGRTHSEEKQLLIFLSSVNIFELVEAKHLDYNLIDGFFSKRIEFLKASKELNETMGNHLILLSELLIQNDKIPSDENLLNALREARESIPAYIQKVGLPEAREGALILRNLFDYQDQLLQEILAIRCVMENVKADSKISFRGQDSKQFITPQEYKLTVLLQNFSLKSILFRHSLRFTIAIIFAYLLGLFFDIQNNYWILLTILVIMRPNYGLTKERSKDRILGTLIGAAFAFGIVLITQSFIVYSVLAIISLILSFALIQQNYKYAAALITICIVFVYSLSHTNSFEVIKYRVIATLIGAVIAVIANYLILPSWQADNLKQVLINAVKMNKNYLLATQELYQDTENKKLSYNLARKEAFLAISNLNAAFQRLTQDPKSKQKEFQLIYEIVTLNHTQISAIASIGNFIISHKTTPVSIEFNSLITEISNSLQTTIDLLEDVENKDVITEKTIENADEKLLEKYKQLASIRDENINQGNTELDTETLHGLQEAYLIANQMKWLKTLSNKLKKSTESYRDALFME